jgi:hypothetical protein
VAFCSPEWLGPYCVRKRMVDVQETDD